MHRSQPFARAHAMMAAIAAAMGLSSFARDSAMSAIGPYKSRGKGRAAPSRRYGKQSGRTYPFSSARQDARCAEKYYTTAVNGFEVMQSRSSKEIAVHELKLAA